MVKIDKISRKKAHPETCLISPQKMKGRLSSNVIWSGSNFVKLRSKSSDLLLKIFDHGAGDSVYSLINGGIEIVARISFVYLLTAIPFIGMWGIFLTTGLTWLVTAIFAFARYKGEAWMSKSLVK